MSPPALELERVGVTTAGRRVIEGVTLRLAAGERLAVLGGDGSGKTTLARIALGLEADASGRVRLFGEPLEPDAPSSRRLRARVGVVLQGGSLLGGLTAGENVRLGLGRPPAAAARRLAAGLDRLLLAFGAEAIVDRPVEGLSTGERRRVELARAFARDPDLLLLDEAFAGADPETARALEAAVVRRLARRPAALLLLTQDEALAARLCSRVLRLERGGLRDQQPVAGGEAAPAVAS